MTTTNNTLPANVNPEGDICITLTIPDDTEWLWLVQKCLAFPASARFWQGKSAANDEMRYNWEERVLSPFIERIAIGELCSEGETMSCTDVADCIETEGVVQEAITESITNNGFTPNPSTDTTQLPPPSLTPAQKSENLIPEDFDCIAQPQMAMGIARAIVKELHESAEDFFEAIEYATNAAEAVAMGADLIPVFGKAAASALEFVDWVLDTMKETYQAAYTQNTEDELACMIFCHLQESCELSIDDLIALYEDKGSITIPPADDINSIMTFMIGVTLSADIITVAIFHYQVMRLLAWGNFAGLSAVYLRSIINSNVSASDYTYETLCDDCVEPDDPTIYWKLILDFRVSQHNTAKVTWNGNPNDGDWQGNGYEANAVNVSTTNVAFGYPDLGGSFVINAVAQQSVRRGSDGNGSNDIVQQLLFPNANYGGTSVAFGNQGSITANTNEVMTGLSSSASVTVARSVQFRARVNENAQTGKLRVYKVAIWGKPNAGVKPYRSVWAGDTLPTTPEGILT